jgi:hypothetical protein
MLVLMSAITVGEPLPTRRVEFVPKPVHVGFAVDKVA